MMLNADFRKRAAVHAAKLPWVPSPVPGVERRMLDRVGGEVARATSIVRFAAESSFAAHTHGGGEEFLVLDGVFQDEDGDYPAGTYVRNPPGSSHTPRSSQGCTLFVKLWQFAASDRRHVCLDTNSLVLEPSGEWPLVSSALFFRDEEEEVYLEHWAPGADIVRKFPAGAEMFVLDGSFEEGGQDFSHLSWLRLPPGDTVRTIAGATRCKVWIKTGGGRASTFFGA